MCKIRVLRVSGRKHDCEPFSKNMVSFHMCSAQHRIEGMRNEFLKENQIGKVTLKLIIRNTTLLISIVTSMFSWWFVFGVRHALKMKET